jgi:hypothetical protein
MADTTSTPGATVPRQGSRARNEPTGWVGWIVFAGVMMVMIGTFHGIQGLIAIFKDEYYLVGDNGLTVSVDYTAWGWTHLIGGAIVFAAGLGVLSGQTWARVVGVIVAIASAVLNFAFLAAYPFWSSIVIAMDVFVIYALCVHGREMQSA